MTFGLLGLFGVASSLLAWHVWPVAVPETVEHAHAGWEARGSRTSFEPRKAPSAHAGWEGPEPHRHPHRHAPQRHRHRYVIDLHHQHWPA